MQTDTRLADRTATLHNLLPPGDDLKAPCNVGSPAEPEEHRNRQDTRPPNSLVSGDALAKVRHDLAEAQRSRASMEARLHIITTEGAKLKTQASLDNRRIAELLKEKSTLITRTRDRDEELRGKAKLLEVCPLWIVSVTSYGPRLSDVQDVHDENLSLTLQLNMAEDQSQKLRQENKELVDRWMKRMGQEAEALNITSKYS